MVNLAKTAGGLFVEPSKPYSNMLCRVTGALRVAPLIPLSLSLTFIAQKRELCRQRLDRNVGRGALADDFLPGAPDFQLSDGFLIDIRGAE